MAKVFCSGDKVFAKMRGYPPWPARIEGIADSSPNNMKYHVLFYGTAQSGICRSQDLFLYEENKDKYGKIKKRKLLKKALDQIEGLAPVPQLVPKIVDEKYKNGICSIHTNKNSLNDEMNNQTIKSENKNLFKGNSTKAIAKESGTSTSSTGNGNDGQGHFTIFSPENVKNNNSCIQRRRKLARKTNYTNTSKVDNIQRIASKPSLKCKSEKGKVSDQLHDSNSSSANTLQEKIDIVLCKESDSILAVGTPDSKEKQMSVSVNKLETVSRSGRIIKRKAFPDESEESIPKKKHIHQVVNHKLQQQHINRHTKNNKRKIGLEDVWTSKRSPLMKETPRNWLATENCMTRLDALVKAQLGLTRANPEQSIRFLDELCTLRLRPLMLKKHPEVVETIKKLRKYVGNPTAWNYSEEQKKVFAKQAFQIRSRAELLFEKFRLMFSAPDDSTFLETFADSVIAFNAKTQHLSFTKVYGLVKEPKTKLKNSVKPQKVCAKSKNNINQKKSPIESPVCD